MKRLLAMMLLLLGLSSALLAGCVQDKAKQEQGEIVYGFTGDPIIFNPILATDLPSGFVNDRVFQGLMEMNEKLEMIPCLAEEVDYPADGKVWTFTLRKNVKWQDGTKFTAADVKYTYEAVMSPDYTGVRQTDFANVEKVEAIGDREIKLYLTEPDASLITKLDLGIIPKHVFEKTSIAQMRYNPANLAPIGTGPYQWGEWAKGQYIVLGANENFWREGPWIKQVRIKFYQDNQVMLSSLEAGEIDYMGAIPVDDVDRIKQSLASSYNFYDFPDNGYTYIGLKQTHPILRDKLVRQALAYGVDRKQIVDNIFRGYGTVMNANIMPFSFAYNPNLNDYAYNPDKARSLLGQAGWSVIGSDGIRVKDNKRLTFKLITSTGSVQREAALSIVKEQWKAIGVDVQIEYFEWSVLCDKYLDRANFESYMLGWSLGTDPDCYLYFHSASAVKDGLLVGFNDVEYKNERVDQLLQEGRVSLDPAKRQEIYREVQLILNDELPYIFMYTQDVVTAISQKFAGVVMSPLGPLYPEQWYIKQK